jgi:hypothetical protein
MGRFSFSNVVVRDADSIMSCAHETNALWAGGVQIGDIGDNERRATSVSILRVSALTPVLHSHGSIQPEREAVRDTVGDVSHTASLSSRPLCLSLWFPLCLTPTHSPRGK